ncbi:RHS repeat-associated core domain containing protein [Nitzschia inconspicua]|uniref:RHS repeat-associated core domain containing protein n=1 Tax=Nitzschia inconspicua TaxID=303405 RepID=A0A9K3PFH7_9STRA|nr:RHS repeat-associated core domain containing protein [Nitzschia inconspicua]
MSSPYPIEDNHKKKKKNKAIIENIPDIPDHNDNIHSVPYYVAPMDTINLNDDEIVNVLSGTQNAPIYVSDYEDCSEVAIKGERRIKGTYVAAESSKLLKVQEDTDDDSTAATPQLFEDLLAPPGEAKKVRTQKRKSSSKQVTSTPTSQTINTSNVHVSANIDGVTSPISKDSSAIKSETTKGKTRKTRNNDKNKRQFLSFGKKKKANVTPTDKPFHIDVTALADDDEDPILEKELEEIALHGGRSGLISGTPGKDAYDLEHGKSMQSLGGFGRNNRRVGRTTKIKVAHKPGYRDDPSVTYVDEEDEADKSWHGMLIKQDPNKKRWTKKIIIWTVAGVTLVLIMVIVLSVVITKNNAKPKQGDPLTEEQQHVHDVLTKITGPKLLADPTTPQHLARQWLLYEDEISETATEEGIIQRYVLAVFHFATGGGDKRWVESNWLIGPECGNGDREPWIGLSCNPEGEVRAMVFDDWGLFGTIPPEVGHLYKLQNLILKNNKSLTGWIPGTFGHLGNLRQLGLYNNNLSGVIPNIFEHTKALEFINLEDNEIHGSIPLEISHLTNLETLVLRKNRFEGIVPFEQLASTSIKYLGLSYNRFSSKLERAMKEVTTLEYVYLDHNEMRGPLPDHIGDLSNLKSIDLGHNHFTGVIPSEIGNLRKLEYLSLNNNDFKGRIPREIGLLNNMRTLDISMNDLTGIIPSISNMINLKNLHLYENSLTGTIPEFLSRMQSLEILFLSSNKFSGSIPKEISRLSRTLKGLYLSDNDFAGSIPTQMCIMTSLEALFLDTNKLSGQIPNCFGQLTDLRQLYLFQNQLTGTVPNNLGALSRLTGMGLESNNLVGEVTDGVCRMVKEKAVDVWADCADQPGQENPLFCSCCSVCCPSEQCSSQ